MRCLWFQCDRLQKSLGLSQCRCSVLEIVTWTIGHQMPPRSTSNCCSSLNTTMQKSFSARWNCQGESSIAACIHMSLPWIMLVWSTSWRQDTRNASIRSVMLAGTAKNSAECRGTQYSDPYGTWDNVVVDAIVRITLKSSYVPVHLGSGKIMLKSGTVCALNDGFCLDSNDGYTFWKPMPTSSCNFNQYDVLYEGLATKIKDDSHHPFPPTIYTLTTQDITFALTKTKEQPLCGYTLLRTEHPKLFILETKKGDTFAHRGSIPVDNRLMKRPGYMAVTAGEAIHVIKCIPVDILVRKTKECFTELPTLYRIEDTWIQLTPEPQVRQMPPQQLQPLTSLSWKYLTPGPLAVSGIYSQKDLEKLRDHIMFPAEKPALLNTMARGMTGHSIQDGSVSMYNLLDEASLQKIAENTAGRVWKGFVTFGSATAGVFGILIVVRLIKLAVDTMIHGYALHSVYGCSLYILGAVWSSLTNLLLHLARGPVKQNQKGNEDDAEEPKLPPRINDNCNT